MIEVARQSLAQAGFADKSIFIHSISTRASLPSLVDVVICDQVGYFGFDAGVVEYLADPRRRFLKPDGITIPRRIDLLLAPIQSDRCDQLAKGWHAQTMPPEFHWVAQLSINSKHAVDLLPAELLGQAATLGSIILGSDQGEFFEWSTELVIEKTGQLHGLGGWFDCELAQDVWMTNSPTAKDRIQRSQAFLPFSEVLQVEAGDVLDATIMSRPADNVLSWEVRKRGDTRRYAQSTWLGGLITESELQLRNPSHVPALNAYGRARCTVLTLCSDTRSIAQIEAEVRRQHPDLFASAMEASKFVAGVLSRDAA